MSCHCLSPGWLLNVYPADAHRGPDFSVDTEPDDGVPSALQPLLQAVCTNTHAASFWQLKGAGRTFCLSRSPQATSSIQSVKRLVGN